MNKYEIGVWDIRFYKIDEDGNQLLNEDGSVKLFTLKDGYDVSWVADSMESDWLEEVTPGQLLI